MNTPRKHLLGYFKNAFVALAAAAITLVSAGAQQAAPGFSASLSPDTIGPGSTATLTFQIDNSASNEPVTDLAFTATLPAGVTIATPSGAATDCLAASLNAPDGGTTITFADGRIGAGESCTVSVNVSSAAAGAHLLNSGDLTSSAGNSGPASATLTVATDRPGFSKSFSASPVAIGDRVTLTFTFDNTANNATASNLSFTDVLPAGLEVAGPANAVTDCTGGVITAVPGSSTIGYGPIFTGDASVGAGATCTLSVDVVATAVGSLENLTGELTTFNGTTRSSGKATAVLTVTPPPVILFTKQFIDDPAPSGGTATLEFTIQNLNRRDTATNISFTDDLDAALSGLVAVGPLPLDPCGAGSTLTGTSLLTLAGGTLAPEASCTFQVTVQLPGGTPAGDYLNTTSDLTADVGGSGVTIPPASDRLFVNAAPVLTKTFGDPTIVAGGTTTIDFTITNSSTTQSATDIAFTDNLSAFLSGARNGITVTGLPADGFCGPNSTLTFIPATNPPPPSSGTDALLVLTGVDLGPGQSCNFQVALGIPLNLGFATFTNTTDPLTATVGGEPVAGKAASANLDVVSSVQLSKEFIDDPVAPGDTATLQFTILLDESAPGDATDIAFTDDLGSVIAGLVSSSGTLTDICGTGSQITGTSTLSFTGGTLSPGESCTFSVQVAVPAGADSGIFINDTSNVMATISGLATQGEPAEDDLIVTGLIFTKEFIDDPVIPGGTATLRFSLDNTNGAVDATGIVFTDDLDGMLDGATAVAPLPDEPCGPNSVLVAVSGSSLIQFSGGVLAAGDSCDFDVTVQIPANAASDTYHNLTSGLQATIGGSTIVLPAADDELTVAGNLLALSKEFIDDPAAPGGTATLQFTLTNLDMANAATGITFTDDLDAVIPGLASISGTQLDVCGAGSELSGAGLLTLTAGSLGPGESCTFSAQVLVPANAETGNYPNATSAVSGTVNGLPVTGDPASDSLGVGLITFSKRFLDDSVLPGGVATLEFTIANNSGDTVSNIGFTDELDLMIPGATAIGIPLADVCGTGSTLTGTSSLALAGGSLLPGGSCTFSVDLQIPSTAPLGDRLNSTSDLFVNGLQVALPATATLYVDGAGDTEEDAQTVVVDPGTGMAWVDGVLRPGDIDFYTFTVSETVTVQISSSGGLDTVGELFDDAGNLLNDPVADGDEGGGSNFQSTLTLSAGTYFVKVTGTAPADDGPYMFHLEQSGAEVEVRPDLLISKVLNRRHFKGNNIYNRTARGQKIIIRGVARKNRVKKFFWATQNDGLDDDNIRQRIRPGVPGPAHPWWRVRITQLTGGPVNVTAAFRAGPVDIDVEPGKAIVYKVEFTLKKDSHRPIRRSFRIGGRSNLDTSKLDVVGGTIRLLPVP